MIVRCGMCPKDNNLIGVKEPFEDTIVSHGLCRFHELRSLALAGEATTAEMKEYCAWVKAKGLPDEELNVISSRNIVKED